jgi:hypothetical protein
MGAANLKWGLKIVPSSAMSRDLKSEKAHIARPSLIPPKKKKNPVILSNERKKMEILKEKKTVREWWRFLVKIITILGLVQERTTTVRRVTILGESMTFPLVELSSWGALTTYLIPLHESHRLQTHQELREKRERE